MYYTAPGHRHVQVLVPRTSPTSARSATPTGTPPRPVPGSTGPERDADPVVTEALTAALSQDRATSMMAWRFAPAVRAHIRARQRAAALTTAKTPTTPAQGKVRVLTCHTREGGEFFGTVQAADGTKKAYAAKIEGGKLVSFKVL
ncbi:hypothetical protein GC584_10225 [Corynebacterium sp. zg912]|uniref:Uncharacterized protein n=1 Tax=Corynebacterium wankanglinii TaxID=2735136 RepID=A0A7H0KB83_9CORY|nr:hypothetical protein [Corynebacterium wankanglinii]MBA1838301.1 hypothetical protein [Corynebacterium wankanglinii]MCR5929769.1 hypothetical protein [Corynebacterium sp. zg912]QNP94549.1 hypothetical protein IA203_03190 [Corynebacterium wankanglinii]